MSLPQHHTQQVRALQDEADTRVFEFLVREALTDLRDTMQARHGVELVLS